MMIDIDAECEKCKDQTKRPVGCWDGANGKHGYIYSCENHNCETKQLKELMGRTAEKNKERVQQENGRKGMFAGYIAAKRRDARVSKYTFAKITGCTPAEYSAYENEQKVFPQKIYRKGLAYLERCSDEEHKRVGEKEKW